MRQLIEFHRRVAAGGVAMTTVAYLAVSPEGRTDRHCLLLGEGRCRDCAASPTRCTPAGASRVSPDRPRRAGGQRPVERRAGPRPVAAVQPEPVR